MAFFQDAGVKLFIVQMLEKYAKTTDNNVDDLLVAVVKSKLFR